MWRVERSPRRRCFGTYLRKGMSPLSIPVKKQGAESCPGSVEAELFCHCGLGVSLAGETGSAGLFGPVASFPSPGPAARLGQGRSPPGAAPACSLRRAGSQGGKRRKRDADALTPQSCCFACQWDARFSNVWQSDIWSRANPSSVCPLHLCCCVCRTGDLHCLPVCDLVSAGLSPVPALLLAGQV